MEVSQFQTWDSGLITKCTGEGMEFVKLGIGDDMEVSQFQTWDSGLITKCAGEGMEFVKLGIWGAIMKIVSWKTRSDVRSN